MCLQTFLNNLLTLKRFCPSFSLFRRVRASDIFYRLTPYGDKVIKSEELYYSLQTSRFLSVNYFVRHRKLCYSDSMGALQGRLSTVLHAFTLTIMGYESIQALEVLISRHLHDNCSMVFASPYIYIMWSYITYSRSTIQGIARLRPGWYISVRTRINLILQSYTFIFEL